MTRRQRLLCIAVLLLAMAALVAAVGLSAYDAGGIDLTRLRNALLAKAASASDFNWTPANVPADFAQERAPVPTALAQWHSLAGEGDVLTRVLGIARALPRYSPSIEREQGPASTDLEREDSARDGNALPRALSIARGLSSKPRLGEQIAASTLVTLSKIESTGTGYCVDYTKVFSALAYAAGIPVRQWAFSFEGFGLGHIFNEIWDAEEQRWLMIDVFEGFYPRDTKNGAPLSALEFRERLLTSPASIQWERIAPPLFGFKDEATALRFFHRGANQWNLVWGNLTFSYDQQPLVAFASHFGRLPEQVAAVLTGVQPGVKVMVTDDNRVAFARLMRLRYGLISAAALELILLLALLGACFVKRG